MGKIKRFFIALWEILVIIAYVKFYIMCLVTFAIVLVMAIYIIDSVGGDVEPIARTAPTTFWFAFGWVCILVINKFVLCFNKKDEKGFPYKEKELENIQSSERGSNEEQKE